MGKETFYNYNSSSPVQITREEYINVGAGDVSVGNYPRAVKGSTDFEIWDAVSGGNQLTEGVDYELRNRDNVLSPRAGYDVYQGYKILNATYQTGSIFITYKVVRSYNDADIQNDLRTDVTALQGTLGALPTKYIEGLELSTGADADHQIDIAIGSARNDDDDGNIIVSSPITIDIEDSGLNGLDTGSVAVDSLYYIWAIYNPTGDLEGGIFSLSKTSPTLPAGYTKKRRVRAARYTDGSSNILTMTQKSDYSWFDAMIKDLDSAASFTSRTVQAMSIPPDMIGIFHIHLYDTGTNQAWVSNTSFTDTIANPSVFDLRVESTVTRASISKNILVDSSSQIAYRLNAAQIKLIIFANGFIDSAQD